MNPSLTYGRLRWVVRDEPCGPGAVKRVKVLQQEVKTFISNYQPCRIEWIDVPVEIEQSQPEQPK